MVNFIDQLLTEGEQARLMFNMVHNGQSQINYTGGVLHVYDRRLISDNIFQAILATSLETCRGSIYEEYLREAYDLSNVIIMIVVDEKVIAFSLFSYDIPTNWGYINLTCAKSFEPIKVQLGLYLRCLMHTFMFELGVTSVYTDASNEEIAAYYDRLGYLFGKEPCGQLDEVTEYHQIVKDVDPDNDQYVQLLPEDYRTDKGYRMKMCSWSDSICAKANQSLRSVLRHL
jgi:hypothetical protein